MPLFSYKRFVVLGMSSQINAQKKLQPRKRTLINMNNTTITTLTMCKCFVNLPKVETFLCENVITIRICEGDMDRMY
jgi:hypothetical protein